MKKYLSFFRIRFIAGLQYRTAAWAGVATQFAFGFMFITLYRTLYATGSSAFPMSLEATATYVWLQQAFLSIFMLWMWDKEIFNEITGGGIAYTLARPMDLYTMWFVKNLALRLSGAMLRFVPVLLVAFLLPAPYGLTAPAGFLAFGAFLLTMLLGFFNVVGFAMLVYITTFYTMNPMGVRMIMLGLTDFFAGGIIPIPFLPDKVRAVVELTPFASMQNVPLLAYSGTLSGNALIKAIGLQVFWAAVLLVGGRLWMQRTLRRIVVQGG